MIQEDIERNILNSRKKFVGRIIDHQQMVDVTGQKCGHRACNLIRPVIGHHKRGKAAACHQAGFTAKAGIGLFEAVAVKNISAAVIASRIVTSMSR